MKSKLQVGIIGASGYAGAELLRLLLNHPNMEVCAISSQSFLGKKISMLYPGFYQISNLTFIEEDDVINKSELIFAALPHGLSETIAKKVINQHKVFIDLGADFRLSSQSDYETWYHLQFKAEELHQEAVYGLSELNKEKIKKANLIANPGCYPTCITLGLAPLQIFCEKLDLSHLVIDAKSGATGGGKGQSEAMHFPRLHDAFSPYKIAQHRHTPEIEQNLSSVFSQPIKVSFTPHLLPIHRGILATMYIECKESISLTKINEAYSKFYKNHNFVRIKPVNEIADLKFVQYSNYCDISLHYDERLQRLIVVSCIDNMIKGAAGQAIQNANIRFNFKESGGIDMIPASF